MGGAKSAQESGSMGFGFRPDESEHHFVVTLPSGNREEVIVAEHLRFDANVGHSTQSLGFGPHDAKVRVALARTKWNAIADDVRIEFNRRLKKDGLPVGRWRTGSNAVARLLGKELTLLAWAIEDADPTLIPTAIRNWLGLAPEERWWLFTMTAAATGHALYGRNRGWRKAVRFALTENPVSSAVARPEIPSNTFQLTAPEEQHPMETPGRPRPSISRLSRASGRKEGH